MQIQKVLVANRGEIAIRIFRACVELKLDTVGIYTYEDRYSQHRYKADEAYQIGAGDDPLKPYLDIGAIVQLAVDKGVDAIHPGYGFLSENPEFARKCREHNLIFIGPDPEIMEQLGDKIAAKKIAVACGVPIIESTENALNSLDEAQEAAQRIGFPLILKAAAGGGGRGMRVVRTHGELEKAFPQARREAGNAFGDDRVFLERFIENPKHLEVQLLGDRHGNLVHLFERDCSVQRRYQKVVEMAPSVGLPTKVKQALYDYALAIGNAVDYNNAGTVEFLVEGEEVFFIEVNPRIQVEHTVTEMVTGIDLVKAQIFVAGGYRLSDQQIKISGQDELRTTGCAIQCRITTEDPENDFTPDYGTITTYRSAAGFGIRLDSGSLYQGVRVSPFFDSMLVKVSAHGRSLDGAARKMNRALQEFRIRGVKTNVQFLRNIVMHPLFVEGKATVHFVASHPELFRFARVKDRATRILNYLGDVIVNGNKDVPYTDERVRLEKPVIPTFDARTPFPKGSKDMLREMGPEKLMAWLRNEQKIHYTDTTFRDAHQSLLATRMRTYDMLRVAESLARNHPEIFSLEMWGGATFDVCLRFLHENPWRRLREIRQAVPNILLQMLFRGSNGVGYTAYPDNVIQAFICEAWESGIDIFRIFDSLNWVKAMELSIRAVREETGGIAEAAICYTGDISDRSRVKYDLAYYRSLAKDLENAGAHMIAIKDMAGLLKPYAATELVAELRSHVKLPIHLHTHDTSSLQPATYLKAAEAGVDVIDVAFSGLSGLTSQPNFNAVAQMFRFHEREHPMDYEKMDEFGVYWEKVRTHYYPFESGLRAGTAEVFRHEIPGGQYSNLKPQAIALGLGDRFEEIKAAYEQVNDLFGDLVKVTPSSKVVGDMALYMVTNGLTAQDVLDNGESLDFPDSVKGFFKGMLGQPHGGFPARLQKVILRDEVPFTDRPNAHLSSVDLDAGFDSFKNEFQPGFPREVEFADYLSYLLYPKVFRDAWQQFKKYGNLMVLPTLNFFYGMKPGEECIVELTAGKTIIIEFLSMAPANEEGKRTLFFKLNGQNRNVEVRDRGVQSNVVENQKADKGNVAHVASPLQGKISQVLVKAGHSVKKGQPLAIIEAMKMETTVSAPQDGRIRTVHLSDGAMCMQDDLLLEME